MRNDLVLVRGGGRTGTAIAHRLRLCGFPVVVTEAARPTFIHRRTSFGAAIYESSITVDGVPARRAADPEGVRQALESGVIPVVADPPARIRESLNPWVVVDATGLDRNIGTRLSDAPIVIGVGPGFEAGSDVHAVVESRPVQGLGSFTVRGALPPAGGSGPFRLLAALLVSPRVGRFEPRAAFGAQVRAGNIVAEVGGRPVTAPLDGLLSGLLAEGIFTGAGMRVAEVDPRTDTALLDEIDPRARAVAGGVLEALLYTAALGSGPGQALSIETGIAPPEGDPADAGPGRAGRGVAPAPPGK